MCYNLIIRGGIKLKIIEKGSKIDLHIHSSLSTWTESGDKKIELEKCNKENAELLVKKLKEQNINLFSISDHDSFDFELYNTLKELISNEKNLNILPAVEFTVMLEKESVHVITVFDNKHENKLQELNDLIFNIETKKPKYDEKNAFSKQKYSEIIEEIGCDIITIVHQKCSPFSKKTGKQDLLNSGEEVYEEYISLNYFDAIEFKNPKNEVFTKMYHSKRDLSNCFVTGSDCHDWEVYPQEEKSKEQLPVFSYIKSLPSFKGLKMAVTDARRLSRTDNFHTNRDYLKKIEYKVNGEEKHVELSPGLNVIIGDNSSGKSALIHALTGYPRSTIASKYKQYFDGKNVEISKHVENFKLNAQGEIRSNFENKDFDLFKDLGIDVEKNIVLIGDLRRYCENRIESIKQLIIASNRKNEASDSKLELKSLNKTYNMQFTVSRNKVLDSELEKVINQINIVNTEVETLKKLLDPKLDNEFLEELKQFVEKLSTKKEEYNQKKKLNEFNNEIYLKTNNTVKIKRNETQQKSSDYDIGVFDYNVEKDTLKEKICEKIKCHISYKESMENLGTFENKEIIHNKTKVNKYELYEAVDVDEKTYEEYFQALCSKVFKKGYILEELNSSNIYDQIIRYDKNETLDDALKLIDTRFTKLLNEDLTTKSIFENKDGKYHSSGLNSSIYFELLQSENGLLIFDQPEDDISQSIIKSDVLQTFKELSINNQIIFITHNPQFIVNLDVDNLLFIDKKDDNFNILSGALEYESDDYSIIDLVAESVEGGTDSIQKRWRRYDKNKHYKKQ